MSCECEEIVMAPADTRSVALPILQRLSPDTIATRAAMCRACRWIPEDKGEATPCPKGGPQSLMAAVQDPRAVCAEGCWPDDRGVVRWDGREWIGVPDPIRWQIVIELGREPSVPGCGCSLALKTTIELKNSPWSRLLRMLEPWFELSGDVRRAVAGIIQGWREMRAEVRATSAS